MKITIDLAVGAELFQNIGKMIRLRKRQVELMSELALSTIHHKAVLSDDADIRGHPSFIALDEKGLQVLRRAFRLAVDPGYRERVDGHNGGSEALGAFASKTTTNDDWESFTVPIDDSQSVTLDTQHAKFLIQYLVPRMSFDANYFAIWYRGSKLRKWEMD